MQFRKPILFLSLIGLMVLSSSAYALQSGDFTYTVSGSTVTITKYTGTGGNVVIPDIIDGMSVMSLSGYFDHNTGLAEGVFAYCSGLTSVTIPNSVTVIESAVFFLCTALTSVNIPSNVTVIGEFVFVSCTSLTSITIGNSVKYIGMDAFYGCNKLTSVTIPNSVTSIGSNAFCYCTSLTKAYFLGNAPSMGRNVFGSCASNFSICYTAGSTGFTTPTWYGYPANVCEVTLIELSSFTATPKAGQVIIQWTTESEIDNAGFNLYRSQTENGNYSKINTSLIPAQGSTTQGANYEFTDTNVQNRKTYYYKLEDIDLTGKSKMHGPVSATPRLIYGMGNNSSPAFG